MKVQLANTYNPSKKYNTDFWFATPKFDGVRAVFIHNEGLFTRNNKRINGLSHMAEVLDELCKSRGLSFIDGELILAGSGFQASQSVILAADHEDKANVEFHVFAVGGNFPYTALMLDALPHQPEDNIFRVDSVSIPNSFQAVEDACRNFTSMGYEGVVLRNPDVPYSEGRSDNLIKFKFFKEADLKITGVHEGTGKLEGMLGSLDVEALIDGVRVRSCVGTGLTDKDRKILGEDKNLVGKVLTVKYQALTEKADKNGYFSLRFPVVIGLKEDRDFNAQSIMPEDNPKEYKPSDVVQGKNGNLEIAFQIKIADVPAKRPSYLPDSFTMSQWKKRLCRCRSVNQGIKLIGELTLTIPKILAFAEFLKIGLKNCKYLKAEIIRRLICAWFDERMRKTILCRAAWEAFRIWSPIRLSDLSALILSLSSMTRVLRPLLSAAYHADHPANVHIAET